MSADFWAGYVSGAVGILIGNPLDLVKTRLQAGQTAASASPASLATGPVTAPIQQNFKQHFDRTGTLVKGSTAPILGYGALNALLFVTYNRTLSLLNQDTAQPASLAQVWCAGAAGGLASFVVSAPTELIKCRAQVATDRHANSWRIARDVWKAEGIRGMYYGGGITSLRDAVGYGFYFWSYEGSKQFLASPGDNDRQAAMKVLLCGGLAGIVTWASIFPLDVIKTRVQTQVSPSSLGPVEEGSALLQQSPRHKRSGTLAVAQEAYRSEGAAVFFRGLGICSIRAFVVNAVQWAMYEWMMRILQQT